MSSRWLRLHKKTRCAKACGVCVVSFTFKGRAVVFVKFQNWRTSKQKSKLFVSKDFESHKVLSVSFRGVEYKPATVIAWQSKLCFALMRIHSAKRLAKGNVGNLNWSHWNISEPNVCLHKLLSGICKRGKSLVSIETGRQCNSALRRVETNCLDNFGSLPNAKWHLVRP